MVFAQFIVIFFYVVIINNCKYLIAFFCIFFTAVCSEACANVVEVQLGEERAKIEVLKQQMQGLQASSTFSCYICNRYLCINVCEVRFFFNRIS